MPLNDPRAQVLANVKCLYGSNVEVLTLCTDTSKHEYQAVAISLDPFTATWTKFLHSEPGFGSTQDAIRYLLRESEIRLAKLFSADGNTVPFDGMMVETLTLRREQPRRSSSGDSAGSEFVVVPTPASNLSDKFPSDFVPVKQPVKAVPSRESSVREGLVDNATIDEAVVVEDNKGMKAEFTFGIVQPVEEHPTEIPVEEYLGEVRVEESLDLVERHFEPVPEPEVNLGWDFSSTKKNKKKKGKEVVEEEQLLCSEPVLEPEINLGWGAISSSKKDKKKKGKEVVEEEQLLCSEPVPEPEVDLNWESWGILPGTKKDKKKKGKTLTEEVQLPDLEPDVDLSWGTPSSTKNDKKKKAKRLAWGEELVHSEPVPEPEVDLSWASFSGAKKNKLEPASPPVEECEELKPDEPSSIPPPSPLPLPPHSESRPKIGDNLLRSEALPPAEPAQVAPNRQTVVFTIEFPNEIRNEPLRVMTSIADSTRAAIIDSVNSYLDARSMQGQRRIEITYGVGRNGNVDLSTIEETVWPEYLDYFRQYTRIPELTVSVVDI